MLLCLRSGPLITSTYAINALKRPSEPLRRNSRQLAKTSYFTYPYIVACGLKNFRDFKSKRNVDLFVVLSALRLDLRCLRSGEKKFVKHLLGELLLGLRYFQNTEVRKTDISSGELLPDLRYLRNCPLTALCSHGVNYRLITVLPKLGDTSHKRSNW